eukprot:gene18359-20205_t
MNNSTNFNNLPDEIQHYVGREEEMVHLLEAVERDKTLPVIIIHGKPGSGKSTFATRFGHEMVRKGYDYVIWIDMRGLVHDGHAPTTDHLAMRILDEFHVDVNDCVGKAQAYLIEKCERIVAKKKQLLIILDNADSLVTTDDNSNDITDAYKMMKNLTSHHVKVALTSRASRLIDVHEVQINPFTEAEGRMYVESTLKSSTLTITADLLTRLIACSHGMPLALKILVNAVNTVENPDYLQNVSSDIDIAVLDEEHPMMHLLEISFKHLTNDELELLKRLAVFPSAFSYEYAEKLANHVGKDAQLLHCLRQKGLLEFNAGRYYFHPWLLDYIRRTQWNGNDKGRFQNCFITVYIDALFVLGRKSLEKDKFYECLSEFKKENSNFLHMIESLKKNVVSIVDRSSFDRPANEYISMVFFLADLIYAPVFLDFLKECEVLASVKSKYLIRCCYYDIYHKVLSNKSIERPNVEEGDDEDEYCSILIKRRQLMFKIYNTNETTCRGTDELVLEDLETLLAEALQLPDLKLARYFQYKSLKLLGHAYKRTKTRLEEALSCYTDALNISKDVFGKHPFTIDCHIQIAKFYWAQRIFKKANQWFESAKRFAEIMNMVDIKQYGNYTLSHGRCLIDSGQKNVRRGVALLEQSLEMNCDAESFFAKRALSYLMRVISNTDIKKLLPYIYDFGEDVSSKTFDKLGDCLWFCEDIHELLKASSLLRRVLKRNKEWSKECFDKVRILLVWNKIIQNHPDVSSNSVEVMSNEEELLNLAEEALNNCNCASAWASIMKWLCYNNEVNYERILPYLKTQVLPCKKLLEIITDKFFFEVNAAYRELDEGNTERCSTKAQLYGWNKILAFTTILDGRLQFAMDALHWIDQGATKSWRDLENLRELQHYKLPTTPNEKKKEKLKARKVLLDMMTGSMIEAGKKDELESHFWQLLTDSMELLDLDVKIEIIQNAFRTVKMSTQKLRQYFDKLLQILGSTTNRMSRWHYDIFVNNLPKLLLSSDEFVQDHLHPGVEVGQKVLDLLNNQARPRFHNERRVKFEILHIMAMYTEEKLDPNERLKNAQNAIMLLGRAKWQNDLHEKITNLKDFIDKYQQWR